MIRRVAPWLPAAAWAGTIFWLSSRPRLPSPDVPSFDKVAHFAAYALLGWLLVWAADRSRVALVIGALIGVLYGASDEIHQMYVPGRSPDLLDWIADAAGVAAAYFAYTRRARRAAVLSDGSRAKAPLENA